jgi:hypothetical protein
MIYNVTVYAADGSNAIVSKHVVEGVDEAYVLDAYYAAMGYLPEVMPDTLAFIKKYPPTPPRRVSPSILP